MTELEALSAAELAEKYRSAPAVAEAHSILNRIVRREGAAGRDASWVGEFRGRVLRVAQWLPKPDVGSRSVAPSVRSSADSDNVTFGRP